MKRLISVVFLFMFSNSYSQNLVPNGDFELYSSCPIGTTTIYLAIPWFQPRIPSGSSDYFNSCASVASGASVPNNMPGNQYAHSGNGYAGFSPFWYSTDNTPPPPPGLREYIEIQIITPLVAEKKYNVSFYVSAGDKVMYAIDALGVYFSNLKVQSNDYKTLVQYVPQVANTKGNVISDTMNWVLISGSFIANGGELYMTIGNFSADSATTVIVNNPSATSGYYGAYYYIDDVSVVEDFEDGVGEMMDDGRWMMDDGIRVYPNPVGSECRVICAECKGKECEISISNELGQVVYQNAMHSDTQAFDISFLSEGVYVVRVATREGVYNRRIIKIE